MSTEELDETSEPSAEPEDDRPLCGRCEKPVSEDDLAALVEKGDFFADPRPFHRACADDSYEAGWTDPPLYLSQIAGILGRDEHTVRRWVRDSEQIFLIIGEVPEDHGYLPRDLWPEREDEGWRRIYWKAEQIAGLEQFARVKISRRGWHGSRKQPG